MSIKATAQHTADVALGQSRAAKAGSLELQQGFLSELAVGKRLLGTVQSVDAGGSVVLQIAGRVVRAQTDLALVAGADYEFVVAARVPRIVLVPTQPVTLPSLDRAKLEGSLGPGLGGLLVAAAETRGSEQMESLTTRFAELARRLGSGVITAAELVEFHSRLGHDQEARVLRLDPAAAVETEPLRETLKAQALEVAQRATTTETETPSWVDTLLRVLRGIEVENARRADNGGMLMLPLPVGDGGVFSEARMFVQSDAKGGERERGADRPFTVVLLLELTVLGPVRVDVEVRGEEVGVAVQVTGSDAEWAIRGAAPSLVADLDQHGLTVRDWTVRRVGPSGLPVSDLLGPPFHSDPAARVDIRA